MLIRCVAASLHEESFISNGFSNLKKTAAFTKHQQSDGHLHAAEAYSAWLKQVPIDQQMNEQAKMQESARQLEVYNYLGAKFIKLIGNI
jgi:hypothetical protein